MFLKNNVNFFVGLVYIVHTAGVLLLHHSVDKAVINYHHLKPGYMNIANIPKAVYSDNRYHPHSGIHTVDIKRNS